MKTYFGDRIVFKMSFAFMAISALSWGESINYNGEMAIANRFAIGAKVVSDPKTPDSAALGNLFTRMLPEGTSGKAVGQFIFKFFNSWARQTSANGVKVITRPKMESVLVSPWAVASQRRVGGPCFLTASCLDPLLTPFRLIAILYRPDLTSCNGSQPVQAGEVRYVFGINAQASSSPFPAKATIPFQLDGKSPQSIPGNALDRFTLIVENGLPMGKSPSGVNRNVQYWANRFHTLGSLTCTSSNCGAYSSTLAGIIRDTTRPGLDSAKLNGFPLNHLRTNEVLGVDSALWEIRSFVLKGSGGTTALTLDFLDDKTPRDGLDGAGNGENNSVLLNWIRTNIGAVRDQKHSLTPSMRAVVSHPSAASNGTFQWIVGNAGTSNETRPMAEGDRFLFALNTCNGCHADERPASFNANQSNTISNRSLFYHVDPTIAPAAGRDTDVFSNFVQVQHRATRIKAFENALLGKIDEACTGSVPHFVPPSDFAF